MKYHKYMYFSMLLLLTSCGGYKTLLNQSGELSNIEGRWYLRQLNNQDVRKARVTIEINSELMTMHGFDGCNNMYGKMHKLEDNSTIIPQILTTHMRCRTRMHRIVSKKVHKALNEGFTLQNSTYANINGSTLTSTNYNLFFSSMGKKSTTKAEPIVVVKESISKENNQTLQNTSTEDFSFFDLFKRLDINNSRKINKNIENHMIDDSNEV